MTERRFWVGVASQDHVARAIEHGYAQLNHGKPGALARMRAGDGLVYYSPRTTYPDGPALQAFTAIGRVRTGVLYQAMGSDAPGPFRLDVDFLQALCAPVRPLVPDLSFIRSKTHWGAAFRFGALRISEADFALIMAAMGLSQATDFPPVAPVVQPAGPERIRDDTSSGAAPI